MWIEKYLFNPNFVQKVISFCLLPFSAIYCIIVYLKFPKKYKDLGIPIISLGNIIVGGSGKTPLAIFLSNRYKNSAVVLRGYGRKSSGCIVVKNRDILVNVEISGDEAMEIALNSDTIVIVSEDREEGILKAKSLGAEVIILDDGFDKKFKKFNIVIDYPIKNRFCLPSGGYRYPRSFLKYSDLILKEGIDFKRVVKIPNCDDCVLISAISKPDRLLKFVNTKKYHFFIDHYDYKKDEIEKILQKYNSKTILTTYKDYVKLQKYGFDIKIIKLNLEISDDVLKKIDEYLVKYQLKKVS